MIPGPGLRLEDGHLLGTPSRAGIYDIGFTVTMPGGATYTSIRRAVIDQPAGGSVGLPDLFWPVVIIGIIGGGAGSLGSLLGAAGSLDRLPPLAPGTSEAPRPHPHDPQPGAPQPSGAQSDDSQTAPAPDGTGKIRGAALVPREGAPSEEWARANSQVRGPLAVTGVDATDLLLWALTATAAGVTLILLASRRRDRAADDL